MENLEAAKKKAEVLQVHNERTWQNNPTWKEMMDVLAAYHYGHESEPEPTPEPPKFKAEQWVMVLGSRKRRGPFQLKRLNTAHPKQWWIKGYSQCLEEYLDHATDAEKYRRGAVVCCKRKTLTVEGTIYLQKRLPESGLCVYFKELIVGFEFNECTLITAAPEASDD